MVGILIGCGVIWGVVSGLTHGNWQAGLVIALIVMSMLVKEHRAQRAQTVAATAPRRLVIVEEDPEMPGNYHL